MAHDILVFYGSYRSNRMGIRLANFIVARLRARGDTAELIDAKDSASPCWTGCTRSILRAQLRPACKIWRRKFAPRTLSSSLWANIIGGAAGPEEPDGSFSRRMVLAPRRDHPLFGRTTVRRTVERRLWHGILSEMGMGVIHCPR